jgi:glutathione S-transferase
MKKDKLLGWDVSPYTTKVFAYFNYKGVPYDYRPPNAYTLAKKVQPAAGKMIMPTVFRPNGDVLQDSGAIIDVYESENPEKTVVPPTAKQACAALLVELFSDEFLPVAALHYRWNYAGNMTFILNEFGKSALPYFPGFIQRKVAKSFAGKMKGYLPILGINKSMRSHLEVEVEALLKKLDTHFSAYPFLLGNRPCIGDFSLYGQVYAHLHRDPDPKDLIKKYDSLYRWMMAINENKYDSDGEWLADDQVPDTLMAVLKEMARLQGPLLADSRRAVEQWSTDNPDVEKLPQKVGETTLTLNGQTASRFNITYPYWMMQRLLGLVEGKPGDAQGLLKELGLAEAFKTPLPLAGQLKKARLYRA